jgi:Family of unknown function (DUF6328)
MTDHPTSEGRAHQRDESPAEQMDRNLGELLQELRVAGLGVQVLFGFLLSLPFTTRFDKLDSVQRDLYLITLLLAALSTALLTGPVAYHRLVFHRHEKSRLLTTANRMALGGLVTVGLAISCAVLLVTSFVFPGVVGPVVAACLAGVFTGLWFALPLWRLRHDEGRS